VARTRRWAGASSLALLAACGRIHFDPLAGAASDGRLGDGSSGDGVTATPCMAPQAGLADVLVLGGTGRQVSPSLAPAPDGFMLAYAADVGATLELFLGPLSAAGVLGSSAQITSGGGVSPSLVWNGSELALVNRPGAGSGTVTLRRFDATGASLGAAVTVSTNEALFDAPLVGTRGGDLGVGWLEDPMSLPTFVAYSGDGTSLFAAESLFATTSGSFVAVAGRGSTWGVTWDTTGLARPVADVAFVVLDASGTPLTAVASVTGATAATTGSGTMPTITATDTGYLIAWVDTRDGDNAIYTAEIDGTGAIVHAATRAPGSGSSFQPALATGARGTVITWPESSTVLASWYAAGQVATPIDISSVAVTTTAGAVSPVVTTTGAAIAWYDDRSGDPDIHFATIGCP
jgi:hypothetical protein